MERKPRLIKDLDGEVVVTLTLPVG